MAVTLPTGSNAGLLIAGTRNQIQNVPGATLSAWVNATGFANTENYIIAFSIGTSTTSMRIHLSARSSGVWRTATRCLDSNSASILDSTTATATKTWFHLATVVDYTGSIVTLYVNGKYNNSMTPSWGSNSSDTASQSAGIGIRGDSSTSTDFNGRIEDVRVYNRALSAAEIETIYTSRGADYPIKGLINRWDFIGPEAVGLRSGTGGAAQDIMGRNNLTIVNSPLYSTYNNTVNRRRLS